VIHIYTFNICC